MERQARLLIVEDHPLYREGLVKVLAARAPGMACLTVSNAADALQALRNHADIDLVLSDYRLPGIDGLELLQQIGRLFPTVARVLVSGVEDARLPLAARQAGLSGFLPKTLEPQDLLDALSLILEGDEFFPSTRRSSRAVRLTSRQTQILEQVCAGKGNKQIARELGISDRTVKYHLTQVLQALSASTRAEAVARATGLGLLGLNGIPADCSNSPPT